MSATLENPPVIPPSRRPDLILRQVDEEGAHVIKDPIKGNYFQVGEQEFFLLSHLDGAKSVAAICTAFEQKFGEPFTAEDLDQFLQLSREQGFLQLDSTSTTANQSGPPAAELKDPRFWWSRWGDSLLYIRRSLCDPDRFLSWLAPKVRFLWTRAFFLGSLAFIVLAGAVLVSNWQDLLSFMPRSWGLVILAWLAVGLATALHELAHGLTCKHHGGEVHEIGFLLMFFLPCFYCNVSDAWLLRERSKRLWITFAGTYCDLCVWALAVFLWRLTLPDTLVHSLALLIITVCGVRILFNFNPLLKLDGYYLLSDWMEIPNLRQQGNNHFAAHLRSLLWGADLPARQEHGTFLFLYGLATWTFSIVFLLLMLVVLFEFLGALLGWAGLALVVFLALKTVPGLFIGFAGGEIMNMIVTRHKRTLIWGLILGSIAGFLLFFPVADRAGGFFRIRPANRVEVRAPVSGFLQMVYLEEGSEVTAGTLIGVLDIPDLASRLAQKQAEVVEIRAKLRLLQAGTRKEELHEQTQKVVRARAWRDLAEKDLERKKQALEQELQRLNELIAQHRAEMDNAQEALTQGKRLYASKALPLEQLSERERNFQVAQAQFNQAHAQKKERMSVGGQEAESELARRTKELADAQATLSLMEAGSRPEDIDAQKAHLDRLDEEVKYLQKVQTRARIVAPLNGVVTTARLGEKVGQFLKEGDLICEIEDLKCLDAEIPLLEQELTRVEPGQTVELKARAVPFQTFYAKVNRMAPAAAKAERGEGQSTLTLYCRLDNSCPELKPGMTGYARIECGRRSLGAIFVTRVLRYVRTEFWW